MKKIFVCSPLRGNIEENIEKAKSYCAYVAREYNYAPFAPHIFCTQFLNDEENYERDLGINIGLEFLKSCDELWAFCNGSKPSSGMEIEINLATELKIPIKYF